MVYYCFLAVLPWPLDMVVKQEHGILKQGRQVVNNILSNLNGTLSYSTLERNLMYRALVNAE